MGRFFAYVNSQYEIIVADSNEKGKAGVTVSSDELDNYNELIPIRGYRASMHLHNTKSDTYKAGNNTYRVLKGTALHPAGMMLISVDNVQDDVVRIGDIADEVMNISISGGSGVYDVEILGSNTIINNHSFNTTDYRVRCLKYPKIYKHEVPFIENVERIILPENLKVIKPRMFQTLSGNRSDLKFVDLSHIEKICAYAFAMNGIDIDLVLSTLNADKLSEMDLTAFSGCCIDRLDLSGFGKTTFAMRSDTLLNASVRKRQKTGTVILPAKLQSELMVYSGTKMSFAEDDAVLIPIQKKFNTLEAKIKYIKDVLNAEHIIFK